MALRGTSRVTDLELRMPVAQGLFLREPMNVIQLIQIL